MTNYQGAPLEEQVKKLLEQNLAYSQQIYLISKKLKSYMLWSRTMGIISFLLVIIPIIVGLIFLPNLINGALSRIMPAGLGSESSLDNLLQGTNLNKEDLLNAVKNNGGAINSYKNILDLYKQ